MSDSTDVVRLVFIAVFRAGADGQPDAVLLGRKLRGFGAGNVVVPSGKIDAGETSRAAAIRELAEETSLHAVTLYPAGQLHFSFAAPGQPTLLADVWRCETFDGSPESSDELAAQWFPLESLPLTQMWADSARWLPRVISGAFVDETFCYATDGVTLLG